MPTIEQTMTTSAGLDAAWAFLSDFTTEQWDPPTVATFRTTGDARVGTRYPNTSRDWGHGTHIVHTVTERHAPRLLRLEGRSDAFSAQDITELTDPEQIGRDAAEPSTDCLDQLGPASTDNAADRRRLTTQKDAS